MKIFVVAAVLSIGCPGIFAEDNLPVTNKKQLDERMNKLREAYKPFLRSLPDKVDIRTRQDLSSDQWLSCYEDGGAKQESGADENSYKVDLDDSGWAKTTVPEWRYAYVDRKKATSCILWYRTKFKADPVPPSKRVFLVFGGVDWTAEVWLNGKKMGTHSVFHEPFRFDVTDVLKAENSLAVRVLSGAKYGEPAAYWSLFPAPTMPNKKGLVLRDKSKSHKGFQVGDPHMGSGYGIHREVYLETAGTASVSDIYARGKPEKKFSSIRTIIDSSGEQDLDVEIEVIPENFEGKAYKQSMGHKAGKGKTELKLDIPMAEAKLWSPDTPYLYRCRVTLKEKDKVVDVRDVLFGYRSFTIVSDFKPREGHRSGRYLLNNEPIVLHGANIQGMNALWYWGETDKIVDVMLLLKSANYNAVRVCQHVQYPEVREIQDRMGIMSEQDLGSRTYANPEGLIEAAGALARHSYNNPGVVLHSYGNECHYEPEDLVRATLKYDPDRIIIPISGHPHMVVGKPKPGKTGYPKLPDELWANVVDNVHSYQGWYGLKDEPYKWVLPYPQDDRMVTIGEFGSEGLDGYETMLKYPEHWGKTPAKSADVIYGHVQTKKDDLKQIMGFRGKKPSNLGEQIEASQTIQADMTGSVAKGLRMSRRVCGYFQFHFVDVLPATWPKSIVSHDFTPKKAYYAMSQINQWTVALPHIPAKAEMMEIWVDNDTATPYEKAVLEWSIHHKGEVALEGKKEIDIPCWDPLQVETVKFSDELLKANVIDVYTKLLDPKGKVLSTYHQEFYVKSLRDIKAGGGKKKKKKKKN